MNANGREGKKNKTRLIGFRVDEDAFSEIENRAILAGKPTNDWCRDELLARLADGIPLTANEEFIHSQILRFGRMTLKFFDLLVNEKLTKEDWQQVVATHNSDHREMAKKYFAPLMPIIRKPRE